MAVADHLYRFTLVDVGAYGSKYYKNKNLIIYTLLYKYNKNKNSHLWFITGDSDGGIFNESQIGIKLNNEHLNLPKEAINLPDSNIHTYFLADDAFKLSNRIMKPYSGKNMSDPQKICNYRFSRARRTVESAFGILANKWRIFHTAICLLPETANIIVTASICLHNYILKEEQCSGYKLYSQEIISENNTNQVKNEIIIEMSNGSIKRDTHFIFLNIY